MDDRYVSIGDLLSFSIYVTNAKGNVLVYTDLGLPNEAIFSQQTFSWIPNQVGIYLVTFIVSDYKSLD